MKLDISEGIHVVGRQIAEKLGIKYLAIRVQAEGSKKISFLFKDPETGTRFSALSVASARRNLHDIRQSKNPSNLETKIDGRD